MYIVNKSCHGCIRALPPDELFYDERLTLPRTWRWCRNCLPKVVDANILHCSRCNASYMNSKAYPPDICPRCRMNDLPMQLQVVARALERPVDSFAPRDLTIGKWLANLQYFKGMCAYCQVRSYACLEHFVPTCLGGGTTASNCVPSCLRCNRLKNDMHPACVTTIPQEDIERVRSYLMNLI